MAAADLRRRMVKTRRRNRIRFLPLSSMASE
jgi:hypothetical protein